MTQLRCCDCNEPFQGLTEEDADTDEAQCERCQRFGSDMGWPSEPEEELSF